MRLGDLMRKEAGEIGTMAQTQSRSQTLSENLKDKIQYHEDQLHKIKATLQLLETNQDIEKLLFLMNEIH